MRAQCIAHEPDDLREPRVIDLEAEFAAHQLGDLVLEPLLFVVGERQVARIGANLELAAIDECRLVCAAGWSACENGKAEKARPVHDRN